MPALTQSARDYENALVQNRQLQAAVEAARIDKLRFDIEKAREETMAGRAELGERIAMINERDRQAKEGVAIGSDVAKRVLSPSAKGGIGLLEGTKMQSEMELQNRMEQGRLGAIQQYGVEKGIIPSAKVDVGGITQTVPAMQAPQIQADTQTEIYNASVPRLKGIFLSQGYSEQEATKLASDAATKEIIKNSNSGKISMLLQDGSIVSLDLQKAMQMAKDPSTPPSIKSQIIKALGETETPSASTWVNTRLGR
jgi:hypothetical protein